MRRVLWILGCLWALPVTLAGLLLATVAMEKVVLNQGAMVFRARPWFRAAFFSRFHVAAFCWAQCVFIASNFELASVLEHELVHFKQARIFGVFLPLAYGVGALAAMMQGGHPYRDNFLEKWAREESGR